MRIDTLQLPGSSRTASVSRNWVSSAIEDSISFIFEARQFLKGLMVKLDGNPAECAISRRYPQNLMRCCEC